MDKKFFKKAAAVFTVGSALAAFASECITKSKEKKGDLAASFPEIEPEIYKAVYMAREKNNDN